jgi:hypothetical protein
MKTSGSTRTAINLTASDKQVLRAVKRQLEQKHGKLTTTAVVRLALRGMVKE